MVVHDFDASLELSHGQEDAPWWGQVYRRAFYNFASMASVRNDGWAQRGGIDRVITLTSGKTLTVDEKVRSKDYGDILLEYWSNEENKIPGWVALDLACDFIAYAVIPIASCYLIPFQLLRRAWQSKRLEWVKKYPRVPALNRHRFGGGGYTTVSVAVPKDVLFNEIRDSMCVTWETAA